MQPSRCTESALPPPEKKKRFGGGFQKRAPSESPTASSTDCCELTEQQQISKAILNEVMELKKSTLVWMEENKTSFEMQIRETTTVLRSETISLEERLHQCVDMKVKELLRGIELRFAEQITTTQPALAEMRSAIGRQNSLEAQIADMERDVAGLKAIVSQAPDLSCKAPAYRGLLVDGSRDNLQRSLSESVHFKMPRTPINMPMQERGSGPSDLILSAVEGGELPPPVRDDKLMTLQDMKRTQFKAIPPLEPNVLHSPNSQPQMVLHSLLGGNARRTAPASLGTVASRSGWTNFAGPGTVLAQGQVQSLQQLDHPAMLSGETVAPMEAISNHWSSRCNVSIPVSRKNVGKGSLVHIPLGPQQV